MSIYELVVTLHNIVRWFVLILGIIAFIKALIGWIGKGTWETSERKIATYYTIAIDIQLLLGLALFLFFSPNTTRVFQDFNGILGNETARFFVLEHTIMMILAIVFVHLGNALTKKDIPDSSKFKRATILFGLALLAIILGMPWDRPLIPVIRIFIP